MISYDTCLIIWLTSFSVIISGSIHVLTNGMTSFFYGWVIAHCIYVAHLLYPFICRWTFSLLIVNRAAVDVGMGACNFSGKTFLKIHTCPGVGLLNHMVAIFLFFKNLHNIFHCGCSNSHFHQHCRKVPFSLHGNDSLLDQLIPLFI